MRKFIRIALLFCLAIAAVPALLGLWFWYKTAEVDAFYRERPLLGSMRERQSDSTNDSVSARQALLEIIPLGTGREVAIATLRKEGFGCQTAVKGVADAELRQRLLESRGLSDIPTGDLAHGETIDCQAMSPPFIGYDHWIVDLQFDADGRLIDALVKRWNIFL